MNLGSKCPLYTRKQTFGSAIWMSARANRGHWLPRPDSIVTRPATMTRLNFFLSGCRYRIWRAVSWQAARPYRASVRRRISRQIVQSCHRSLPDPTCTAPAIRDELQPLFWPVSDRPLSHPEFSGRRTIDQLALHPRSKLALVRLWLPTTSYCPNVTIGSY